MTKIAELTIKKNPDRIVLVIPFSQRLTVSAGIRLWDLVVEGLRPQIANGLKQAGLVDDWTDEKTTGNGQP